MSGNFDAVVMGAGVFGAWTALRLRRSGRNVALIDIYGAGNSRSSSGGETRILRAGYGADEIYTRWAMRARELWLEFFDQIGRPELFQNTGVLWTPPPGDARAEAIRAAFEKCRVEFQHLSPGELSRSFPQFCFRDEREGLYEMQAGVILARRAVQAVVAQAIREGVAYSEDGSSFASARDQAGIIVYACGPWLPKIFPEILGRRIRPTRQEIFFFGTPAGDSSFAPPRMPAWTDITDEHSAYTLPNIENRGLKLAFDRHGPEFDPDTGDRVAKGLPEARAFLAERFPSLAGAPLVESRVCQYENTSNGDFLIDRHPDRDNVWLVGGGSGHGFKHGPAVGEHVCALIDSRVAAEPRFSLQTKARTPQRSVF
ncbi:MAG TPA: FAD-dependent oxidoreductase [Bryobacteraceae bacterium]|nr:FAD-dependent oxidoreductase [Bryobacteraceae bacterium]